MEWDLPKAVNYSGNYHKEAAEVEYCSHMIHPNFNHSQFSSSIQMNLGLFKICMASIQLLL